MRNPYPKSKIIFADFETLNIEKHWKGKYKNVRDYYQQDSNPVFPEVYSWSIGYPSELEDKRRKNNKYKSFGEDPKTIGDMTYHLGLKINSFMHFINLIPKKMKICFNNSRGFDAHFIIPFLNASWGANYVKSLKLDINNENFASRKIKVLERIQHNLKDKQLNYFKKLKNDKDRITYLEFLLNKNERHWNNLFIGEWSCIVDKGKNIKMLTYMNQLGNKIEIIDNLDLFPMSVMEMGELLNHHYKTDKYSKLELNGGYKRSEHYNSLEEFENDGNEKEYLLKDVEILCKYNLLMREKIGNKNCKMTIASTSYKMWKKDFGQELLSVTEDIKKVKFKNGLVKYKLGNKLVTNTSVENELVNSILPTEWLDRKDNGVTIHTRLYKFYYGGLTHLNPIWQGIPLRNITAIDINSSYPAIMNSDLICPIGEATIGNDKEKPFKFYKILITKNVENKTGLPFVFRLDDEGREYVSKLKLGEIFKLTSASIEQFKKYYNLNETNSKIEVEFSFKQTTLKKLFGKFIEKWYKLKEYAVRTNNKPLKAIAKLMLNALYGKFGTKSIRESKYWNEIQELWSDTEEILNSEYYLPLGIVITEYARMKLVEVVGNNYKNFVYCDTDSAFFINWDSMDKSHIDLHPTKLGSWDIEMKGGNGVVRRAKQYYFEYKKDNKIMKKIAFAGINFNKLKPDNKVEEEKWEKWVHSLEEKDFIIGRKIDGQLNTFKPVGGSVAFTEVVKEIKPIWEYKKKSEQIYYKEKQFRENYFGKEK